jgi:hypothetical protein
VVTVQVLNLQLLGSCAVFYPYPCTPVPDKNHPGFYNAVVYTLHVVESGGVACNMNFLRLEMYEKDGTFLEATQQGPDVFTGGNRLNAGQTRDFTEYSYFNSDIRTGRSIVISVGTTDDKGNIQIWKAGQLVFG